MSSQSTVFVFDAVQHRISDESSSYTRTLSLLADQTDQDTVRQRCADASADGTRIRKHSGRNHMVTYS